MSPGDRTAPLRLTDVSTPEVMQMESRVEGVSVEISWETRTATTGQVWLGTSPEHVNVIAGRETASAQQHIYTVADLAPDTRYYFRIVSVGEAGGVSLSPPGEFQTGRAAPLDDLRRTATNALQPVTCAVRPALRPAWQWVRLYPWPAASAGGLLVLGVLSIVWRMRRKRSAF
jgi:hypothetical protein